MIGENNVIWVLSEDFPTKDHPSFVFVEQLVLALLDAKAKVKVIAPQSITKAIVRRRGFLPRHSEVVTSRGNRFEVFRPYKISLGNHFKRLTPILTNITRREVTRILNKSYQKGDVLYGHFWSSGYILSHFAGKHHAPLFVACGEGDNAMEVMASNMSEVAKRKMRDITTGVIAVSTENKRKSVDMGFAFEENICVLPNCVDDTLFYPRSNDSLKKKLGITEDNFTIAFVGAFIKRKGTRVLSEAIDLINNPNLKSIFIGGPQDNEDYSPTCKGIVFKGRLSHELIPEYLSCADVFVLPTQNEGCCNAIVESLACGIPVISSDKPFNNDILNNNNSLLVDPDSSKEVATAIKTMMDNEDTYINLKRYAINHAGEYSIKNRAQNILEFINDRVGKMV